MSIRSMIQSTLQRFPLLGVTNPGRRFYTSCSASVQKEDLSFCNCAEKVEGKLAKEGLQFIIECAKKDPSRLEVFGSSEGKIALQSYYAKCNNADQKQIEQCVKNWSCSSGALGKVGQIFKKVIYPTEQLQGPPCF